MTWAISFGLLPVCHQLALRLVTWALVTLLSPVKVAAEKLILASYIPA
jgi:hypothetical protein